MDFLNLHIPSRLQNNNKVVGILFFLFEECRMIGNKLLMIATAILDCIFQAKPTVSEISYVG